jgi:hypothetical protein
VKANPSLKQEGVSFFFAHAPRYSPVTAGLGGLRWFFGSRRQTAVFPHFALSGHIFSAPMPRQRREVYQQAIFIPLKINGLQADSDKGFF